MSTEFQLRVPRHHDGTDSDLAGRPHWLHATPPESVAAAVEFSAIMVPPKAWICDGVASAGMA